MDKIWIVSHGSGNSRYMSGAFDDEEKARAYGGAIANSLNGTFIEVVRLNPTLPIQEQNEPVLP